MLDSRSGSRHGVTLPLILVLAGAFGGVGCSKPNAADADGGGGAASASTGADSLPALLTGFEGEIDVSAKNSKPQEGPTDVAVRVKNGKIRVDIPEQLGKSAGGAFGSNLKGFGLLDSAAKKIYVVLDPSKQVIEIDLNKSGNDLKGIGSPGPRAEHGNAPPQGPPPKVTKTGKYDTVAGYKCENWDIASDHKEGTACVAQEGFSWFQIPITGIPTEHLWMAELLDGKHFPLRFIGYGPDGTTETARIEVTKIDKKTLPASDFEIPPGYTVVDIAQMFRGFGAFPGGGMPGAGMPGAGMPGGMPPGMPPGMTIPPRHK
jgi:hypothetical protein